MLSKEIIAVYTDKIMQNPQIKNAVLLVFNAAGTYFYHSALKI
jgi:hypothetical protein